MSLTDLLRRLKFERVVPSEAADLFHQLRIAGNRATHAHQGDHADALTTLKLARQLGIWFHRTFADARFSAGPFAPPPDPGSATKELHNELQRLRQVLDETRNAAEKARADADAQARERQNAEERAHTEREEKSVWEQIAREPEAAKAAVFAQLETLQQQAAAAASMGANSRESKPFWSHFRFTSHRGDDIVIRYCINYQVKGRGGGYDKYRGPISSESMEMRIGP